MSMAALLSSTSTSTAEWSDEALDAHHSLEATWSSGGAVRVLPRVSTPGRPRERRGSDRRHGGVDDARHGARRAAAQRRGRAVALTLLAAGLVCGLALPLSVLGGAPASQHAVPGSAVASQHATLSPPGETVYVVRSGDTLWSIASRFDRGGDPRPLAEALAQETGSDVVVPGERITIP